MNTLVFKVTQISACASAFLVLIIFLCKIGPKPNTVSDFWCMVWQEDVNQIIMLTNLKEGRKVIN